MLAKWCGVAAHCWPCPRRPAGVAFPKELTNAPVRGLPDEGSGPRVNHRSTGPAANIVPINDSAKAGAVVSRFTCDSPKNSQELSVFSWANINPRAAAAIRDNARFFSVFAISHNVSGDPHFSSKRNTELNAKRELKSDDGRSVHSPVPAPRIGSWEVTLAECARCLSRVTDTQRHIRNARVLHRFHIVWEWLQNRVPANQYSKPFARAAQCVRAHPQLTYCCALCGHFLRLKPEKKIAFFFHVFAKCVSVTRELNTFLLRVAVCLSTKPQAGLAKAADGSTAAKRTGRRAEPAGAQATVSPDPWQVAYSPPHARSTSVPNPPPPVCTTRIAEGGTPTRTQVPSTGMGAEVPRILLHSTIPFHSSRLWPSSTSESIQGMRL